MKIISHNKPSLGKDEILAVSKVIESGWVAQGRKVKEFESEFCNFIGSNSGNAVAVSNGTSALFIALKTFEFSEGSEVIIPSYVCSAVLNAIYMAKLTPVIIDVSYLDFNIAYENVIPGISKKTKAIVLPHMFGVPVNIHLFKKLKMFNIKIIEDCATAIGSYISGQHVGVFGDISIFSFSATKFITCGSGGMIFSTNANLIKKALDYRTFDCTPEYKEKFNFQMTDIQAAIGIIQLGKIKQFLNKRKYFFQSYSSLCLTKGLEYQSPQSTDLVPNNYRFVLKATENDILKLHKHFTKNKVGVIIPIEPYELLHNYLKLNNKKYHESEKIAKCTLSLPIYPRLSSIEMDYILQNIKAF